MMLMAPIDEEEMMQAVRSLQRHKSGGPGVLNNDFYIDLAGVVISELVEVCNAMLEGKAPPASFLQGTVVPLRKKGDSDNAMDYRPIMLLQTSYKLFVKVLATRCLQSFLGHATWLRAQQANAKISTNDAEYPAAYGKISGKETEKVAGILLLDFKKAYDTG
ncbi:hypothetical protein ON010_g17727 [Phytophthora cinnamomi]|nr:hypothetical protein ON010_g17727 [Phytophthora cinnamomi]